MRRTSLVRFVVLLSAVLTLGSFPSRAAVPSRIKSAVSDGQMTAQQGAVSPRVRGAVDQGRLGGQIPLTGLSINFLPSAAQQTALDELLQAQRDPSSSSFHKWLTPMQFGAQFGMSDTDLATVTAWLQSHGLQVGGVAPSRNAIHFSGTVAQVEQAFQTELHALSVNGEAHFANTTAPMLPSAFAGTVGAVRGLNDFRPKPHARATQTLVPYSTNGRKLNANASPVPQTTDGTGIEYLSPEDFAKIYNVSAMYNAGYTGSASYPIGIVGQTAINPQDITDFRTSFGLTSNSPTLVLVPNTGTSAVNSSGDLAESELDLEWSGAVAPNAPIYFIYTGSSASGGYLSYDVFNALQYAIQTYTIGSPAKPVPILSISYGECEPSDTAANFSVYESWFQQANAQGQTIISASGDDGAAGCDYTTISSNNYAATQGLAVDYPASSAFVTGVGGTSYAGDVSSLSTYWGSSNDTNYGNELGLFIPSNAWNNTPTATAAANYSGLSSSGGGVSALWAKPAWQAAVAGIPSDGKRDVPDVALNADPNHDGFLVCIDTGCSASKGANASFNVYGGTSVSAPSFAGILALAEQRLSTYEGNVNPLLYGVAAGANGYTGSAAFHDITTGSNIVPCVVNTADVGCSGGTMGYSAGTGYDLVTGLGAVDAFNLTNALSGTAAKAATSSALTYQPSTVVTGQATTFTSTVTTSATGTTPTGTVVFAVDGGTPTAGVAVSGGVATYSTTFTTGGSHTVTAVYSGDTTYYGSTATVSASVAVAVNPNNIGTMTSLVANPANPTALPLGSSLVLTATVNAATAGGSLTGLAGKVTFTGPTGAVIGRQAVTVSGTTGTAVLSVSAARLSLPVGTDTVTATFDGGGANSAGGSFLSSSGTAMVNVTNPAINLTATNITLTNGSSGTSTITLSSAGGYTGTIALGATTSSTALLTYATATFSPLNVVLIAGGSGTSTVTFTTATISSAAQSAGKLTLSSAVRPVLSVLVGSGLSLAGLLCIGLTGMRRRRLPSMLLSLFALALLGGALGCSSSSTTGGGGGGGTTTRNNIPTGVYTITIVGTDAAAGVKGTTNITLTIK